MNTAYGLFFTLLWSTAAIATKFGLDSATPLALAASRFLLAGSLLLIYVYAIARQIRRPQGKEWRSLLILGLLNTTIYLGATFWALGRVSAGLFNLFVTANPFLVAFLSYIWLRRKLTIREWSGMLTAGIGLLIATAPSLADSNTSVGGVIILTIGMLSMAVGSVYFQKAQLQLPAIVINTWQLTIGGLLLLPFTLLLEHESFFWIWDAHLLGSLGWLVFVISIGTMLLWFYLLKQDAVKANNWLFMTPVFGYLLAALLLGEAITALDITATVLVIFGLFLSGNMAGFQLKRRRRKL